MFLLIDKPKGITSHDVVNHVRRATGEKKVGHAGTLDPNASGLLIVAVGREDTRKLGDLTKNTRKVYEAEIFLGEERSTDDSEGEIIETGNKNIHPSREDVERVIKEFVGDIEQVPPIYSAIKIKGKKAYDLARKNKAVKMEPRKVIVYSIKVQSYDFPILKIVCEVSAGTYIRAIARDIGRKLGTYGYLKELRRTKVGEFLVEKAQPLQQLQQ